MDITDQVIFALDILGTIAFAISGALVGTEKKMDIFGVVILGVTTAVGGGVLRDVILNITPPSAFQNPVFTIIAIICSIIMFSSGVRNFVGRVPTLYDNLMFIMDTAGLAVFTLSGVQTALHSAYGSNIFLAAFVGVLTGVGGGLLRDLFAGNMPYIFTKHFYACAAIIGAIVFANLAGITGEYPAMIIGGISIIILRILAALFRWSLPKAK